MVKSYTCQYWQKINFLIFFHKTKFVKQEINLNITLKKQFDPYKSYTKY